ncbi:DUF5060 domain-containing protein [Chitinophagaceae bacterium LB-8]|uniref:DUF5060 domain-containing protein n=1 Tax=Paraflavisolibacter caeni TaxID=2982496 RepID=A0A9X3B6R9_9BACT|nr:DUF5060 domain-containing protein [Paraflavisolibacter caeni]MCU7547626.1 DUF5060 domain-containing protein [Paraflavisolibacter caeni]
MFLIKLNKVSKTQLSAFQAISVTSFTLVNADNEQDIQTLSNGTTLNLATLPSRNLNIRANTSPVQVPSVVFNLSGRQSTTKTENIIPYALFGDNNGNYNSWTPSVGSYTLKATPYSATGGGGTAGTALTVNFQIVDNNGGVITGSLKKWQPITIDFTGPPSSQSSVSPNPFLDYKLQVTFSHAATSKTYNVPGFFDGDGKGGASGNCWRVRFNPDESGTWKYAISFRKGTNVAIDLNQLAGSPVSIDGATGNFTIAPADATAPGFLRHGRLEYSNGLYLKCQDGSYWIKGGTNSPENFIALPFSNHIIDWKSGDPDWNNGQGKGIIGALNYLGSFNVNSIYFMPMNIGGDAQDTWPFAGPIVKSGSSGNDNVHYDINKLAKWEQIFSHAQKKGILLHFVLNEAEAANKQELDNATLGKERKLFYRELIARFGHHNALVWNLCEEYNYQLPIQPSMIKSWAQYVLDVDPYNHPVTVHNYGNPNTAWTPFLGDSRFSVTSFQYAGSTAGRGAEVESWRTKTSNAGRPLPICLDELRVTTTSNMIIQRKEILWPTYFSGGAGLEYYFGSLDQSLQDFRPYEPLWTWTWYARKFMEENLPFWQMQPNDGLLTAESTAFGGGQVFAKTGEVYAVYLPNASLGGTLNLTGVPGVFQQRWYNPRTGAFEGSMKTVTGGGNINIGTAPSSNTEDWVVLLINSAVIVRNKEILRNKGS